MIKNIIYAFLIIIITVKSFAQNEAANFSITLGKEIKESKSNRIEKVIGYDETGTYVLKNEDKSFFNTNKMYLIQHYDNNLNRTISAELLIPDKSGKERKYKYIMFMNNTIYLFSSIERKSDDKILLYVQTIDKKTLLVNTDERLLIEQDSQTSYDFIVEISKDQSKIMIYSIIDKGDKENKKYTITLFDNEFNKIWATICSIPYKNELVTYNRFMVDNNGDCNLLAKVYQNKSLSDKSKGEANYSFKLFCFESKAEYINEYPIELPDKFITDMQIGITDKNDIICAGFYSNIGTNSIKGSCYFCVDGKNGSVLAKTFKAFDLDVITQNMTEKEAVKTKKKEDKGKDVELDQYVLHDIVIKKDGGVLLVGEQFYIISSSSYDQTLKTNITTKHFYSNDIIVVNISHDGKIEWAKKIAKKQDSQEGGQFLTYTMSVFGDEMVFVFNDNPKNLINARDGELYKYNPLKKSIVIAVIVKSDGSQKKISLFDNNNPDILIEPRLCQQISDSEMILFGKNGKKQQLTKIKYN